MKKFVDYVLSFYAKGELYDIGATREEVITATQIRMNSSDHDTPFEGDSFDREYVRDIIVSLRKTA